MKRRNLVVVSIPDREFPEGDSGRGGRRGGVDSRRLPKVGLAFPWLEYKVEFVRSLILKLVVVPMNLKSQSFYGLNDRDGKVEHCPVGFGSMHD